MKGWLLWVEAYISNVKGILFSFILPSSGTKMEKAGGFCRTLSRSQLYTHSEQSAYWQLFGHCWLWCHLLQKSSCLIEGQILIRWFLIVYWAMCQDNPVLWNLCFPLDASRKAQRSKLGYRNRVWKYKEKDTVWRLFNTRNLYCKENPFLLYELYRC